MDKLFILRRITSKKYWGGVEMKCTNKISRKKKRYLCFLLCVSIITSSCTKQNEHYQVYGKDQMEEQLFGKKKNVFGNVVAPRGFDWKQCSGITLDFAVENNLNANVLAKECERFTEVTGIKVRIQNMDFDTLNDRINMDFISQAGIYDLIYVDPYRTLVRFPNALCDLNVFEQDEELPHIVKGLDSFLPEQVEICSYFQEKDKLLAVPFDSTTMIFYYRKDIFEKYAKEMERDLGYIPVPGSREFTWERFIEVAKWMEKNIPKNEILYPSITMSAPHNSLYAEFSNVLSAYGGDYFSDNDCKKIGVDMPKQLEVESESFEKALEMYEEIVDLSPTTNGKFNWNESADLFRKGQVAMMVNWDENVVVMEDSLQSSVTGKVGYTVLPYGSSKSANLYGGSGIGMNQYISDEKKLASWLFIVWCTSPQVQMDIFLEKEGGSMPTRCSLQQLIIAKYMAWLPQARTVLNAQNTAHVYYRPKIKQSYEFETLIISQLTEMLQKKKRAGEVVDSIVEGWEKITYEKTKE